jgi:hypothetical protein
VTDWTQLSRDQQVEVVSADIGLGTGRVDDVTADGSTVWIYFGGAYPRRMFLRGDAHIRPVAESSSINQ